MCSTVILFGTKNQYTEPASDFLQRKQKRQCNLHRKLSSNNDSDITILNNLRRSAEDFRLFSEYFTVCPRVLQAMHPSEDLWTANDFEDSDKMFQPHNLLTLFQLYDKLMTRLV